MEPASDQYDKDFSLYTTRDRNRGPVSGVSHILEVSCDESHVKMSTNPSKPDEANQDDDGNILHPKELEVAAAACCGCWCCCGGGSALPTIERASNGTEKRGTREAYRK